MSSARDVFDLSGRTALVTGATGHLGSEIAHALVKRGADVLVNGRNAQRVAAMVETLRSKGGKAQPAVFDVCNENAVADYFRGLTVSKLHILVNCAYGGKGGTVATSSSSAFSESYATAVGACQIVFSAALPRLRLAVAEDGDASVVNIASMYGVVSPRLSNYASAEVSNPPFYGAAKAALIQWSKYAACEFGPEGIRVNALSPGPFPSPQAQRDYPDMVNKLEQASPLRRTGRPEEIRTAILFLCSPASTYVTGSNVMVDGGWTSW